MCLNFGCFRFFVAFAAVSSATAAGHACGQWQFWLYCVIPVVFTPKGAKFLIAMAAHVICSCACVICEPKPPNCHVASLPAACWVAINLGPRTATTTLTVTAYVAHLIELAEPHRRAWTSCTIACDYATSTYVLQSHLRLHGLSRLCHVICLFDCE